MLCPKCKAKIGVTMQQIATESGKVSGILCYMCGYWYQEYARSPKRCGSTLKKQAA